MKLRKKVRKDTVNSKNQHAVYSILFYTERTARLRYAQRVRCQRAGRLPCGNKRVPEAAQERWVDAGSRGSGWQLSRPRRQHKIWRFGWSRLWHDRRSHGARRAAQQRNGRGPVKEQQRRSRDVPPPRRIFCRHFPIRTRCHS